MSKFEQLLNETETVEEALALQPCLEDNLSEYEVEKIRADFLEEWYNISIYEYIAIMNVRNRRKKAAFAKAFAKLSPAEAVSQAIRSH